MSLIYSCLFASQSPDLHRLLDQLVDEHLNESLDPLTDDNYFYFYESNGSFYLYYNDGGIADDEDSKPLLLIYPQAKTAMYELVFGEFKAESSWYIDTNSSMGMHKIDHALARLLRSALKQYVGDLVSLFNGEQVILYRMGECVYLNESSDIAQEPMVSLLGLEKYELRMYKIV